MWKERFESKRRIKAVCFWAWMAFGSTSMMYACGFPTQAERMPQDTIKMRAVGGINCPVCKKKMAEPAPLMIVDGEEVSDIKDIPMEQIESFTILKDRSAIAVFGEKGKNKVIIIRLKHPEMEVDTVRVKEEWGESLRIRGVEKGNEPLLLVNGLPQDYLLLSCLNPEYIKHIAMRDKKFYPDRKEAAEHGVVVVDLYTQKEVDERNDYVASYQLRNEAALEYIREHGGDSARFVQPSGASGSFRINGKTAWSEIVDALNDGTYRFAGPDSQYAGDEFTIGIVLMAPEEIKARGKRFDELIEGNAYEYVKFNMELDIEKEGLIYELDGREMSFEEFKKWLEAIPAKNIGSSGYSAGEKPYRIQVKTREVVGDDVKQMTVQGVVKDNKGTPLPCAFVRLKGADSGTETDEHGRFSMDIPETKKQIEVSVDYIDHTKVVVADVKPEMEIVLDVRK